MVKSYLEGRRLQKASQALPGQGLWGAEVSGEAPGPEQSPERAASRVMRGGGALPSGLSRSPPVPRAPLSILHLLQELSAFTEPVEQIKL